MPPSDDESWSWRERRAARLDSVPWLRVLRTPGRPDVWYVDQELLVPVDQEEAALALLRYRYGVEPAQVSTVDLPTVGFRRLRHRAIEPVELSRALRDIVGEDADGRVASPHHVYAMTRPFGPPAAVGRSPGYLAGPRSEVVLDVAVVDSGVCTDSPLPVQCYEALPEDVEQVVGTHPGDGDIGHANFVAGVIQSHTDSARVRFLRVLGPFGLCTEADLVAGLARIRGERLVNLSLGGYTLDDQPPFALRDALAGLFAEPVDRLVVAAAGNDGDRERPFWPAAFAGTAEPWHGRILAVAAHDGYDLCDWSNAGPWVTLTARGVGVVSTYVRHPDFPSGWARWSGTSFAVPRVVAALADLMVAGESADSARKSLLADLIRSADGYRRLA